MSATPVPNKFAIRAESLYIQAVKAWANGLSAVVAYPLLHYVGITLADARERYPEAKEWEFTALARRIERLLGPAHAALPSEPEWSPLPDDPNAWVQTPQETRQQLDEWGC